MMLIEFTEKRITSIPNNISYRKVFDERCLKVRKNIFTKILESNHTILINL